MGKITQKFNRQGNIDYPRTIFHNFPQGTEFSFDEAFAIVLQGAEPQQKKGRQVQLKKSIQSMISNGEIVPVTGKPGIYRRKMEKITPKPSFAGSLWGN